MSELLLNQSLISVIVPVYNAEKTIERCIESIIKQTYTNIEIILIDDGSTDLSYSICEQYMKEDQRIKAVHIENSGQSVARNKGLDICRGDFIAFIDSDDHVGADYLATLYDSMIRDSADIAVCDYFIETDDGNITATDVKCKSGIISKVDFCMIETTGNYMFCVALWNKLFRSSVWNNLRFVADKYAEDSFAMTEYLKHGNKITIVKKPLYFYYQRADSLSHAFSIKNLDSVESRLERCSYYHELGDKNLDKNSLHDLLKILVKAYRQLDFHEEITYKKYSYYRNIYKKEFKETYKYPELTKRYVKCLTYVCSDRLYASLGTVKKVFLGIVRRK